MKSAANWFIQKLSDKISISFPKKPVKASEMAYGVKDKDGVIFAAGISDGARQLISTKQLSIVFY